MNVTKEGNKAINEAENGSVLTTIEGLSAVTVIGLGMLGNALANAFLKEGHRTTVWNRSLSKGQDLIANGALRAADVAEALSASPVVVICVSEYDSVRETLTPYSDFLSGRTLVNLSSGTPEQAREMSKWVSSLGAEYLDGAAMSGTRLVGRPEALFLYSGSPSAFTAHQSLLKSLGEATHLGEDPGLASLYDTALYGMNWGVLSGFFHAVSLVGKEVDASTFAAVATAYLPFVTSLMTDYSHQIEDGHYPNGEGTLDIHAGAIDHLIHTSQANGIRIDVPSLFKTLIDRGIAAGHGSNGIASVYEVIKTQTVYEEEQV
ncbi:NAD(P)-dependent oxidoreductase [Paenibacillus harenae]|uniref:NAD(P)-dependent oxidoreductase n=1 Tax=Paenibacillus harenae TaxID=306543 RepID=UPI0004160A01|nr:NAD(P)-binding domain-containing protein [Paenibacillus harenae]